MNAGPKRERVHSNQFFFPYSGSWFLFSFIYHGQAFRCARFELYFSLTELREFPCSVVQRW